MKGYFSTLAIIVCVLIFSNAYAAYAVPSIGSGDGNNSILITDLDNEAYGTATGYDSISIGQSAESSHRYSIAIGYDATVNIGNAVQNTKSSAIAIGHEAKAWGRYAIAFGNSAVAGNEETHSASSSIAIGNNAKATGTNALALGVSTSAERYSTALGNGAKVSGEYAVAIGYNSAVTRNNSTAIGYAAKTESALSTAIGFAAHVYSDGNQGWQNSIAIGNYAETRNSYATAIGRSAKANGLYSISFGYEANTTGSGSISLGSEAQANGGGSVAFGREAGATGSGASAIGSYAQAIKDGAIALGYESYSSVIGGAALGAGSISDRITTSTGIYVPSGIDSGYVEQTVIGNYGVASIGNVTSSGTRETRQLTGVAAGIEMTDAVNVAQLRALDEKLDTFGASVAETLGGGLKYDSGKLNGKYTLSGIEGSPSYDNVQKAIEDKQAAGGGGSNISSGANIKVTETTDGNYQISLEEDITINSAILQKEAALTADSQEAVSGKQIYSLGNNIAAAIGGESLYSSENGLEVSLTVNDKTYNTVQDALNAAKENGSWVLGVNGEKTQIANGGEFSIVDGKNINIKTESDGSYSFNVVDNPEFSSIHVGNVNINQSGIDMGGNKITGLADGGVYQGSSDAVTGGQLWDTYQRMGTMENNIYREMDDLREDVNVVGAHAAALSGLHPIQYNPYEPTTLSAAVGAYRDEYAVAVGVFHYTRENVMFNLGASLCSDGDVMGRAGVSFAVGKSSDKKPRLASTMGGLQKQVLDMQAKLDGLEEKNARNEKIIKQNAEIMAQNEKLIRELTKRLEAKN